jgi:hypothetical protein
MQVVLLSAGMDRARIESVPDDTALDQASEQVVATC